MPYRHRGIWRGCVRTNGKAISKGFKTKAEAAAWEAEIKGLKKHINTSIPKYASLLKCNCESRNELEAKYKQMLSVSEISLMDVLEEMLKDFGLPYTYKDICSIVKNANDKRKTNRKIPTALRMSIFERDGFKCRLCGATSNDSKLVVDHILPVSKGGLSEERNLRTLCVECNSGLSNKLVTNGRRPVLDK